MAQLKGWLLALAYLLAAPASAQSELQCKVVVIHMEARGESLKASRAVLDVLLNRMHKDKLSACQVVKAKGQFPWAAKKKSWKFTQSMLQRYFKVFKMLPVLDKNYLYFNHVKHPFGKATRKIDNLYFSQ